MKHFVKGETERANIALLFEDGVATEFFIEKKSAPSILYNIYRAKVENVRPSGISFLNLGEDGTAVATLPKGLKAGDGVTVLIDKEFGGEKYPQAELSVTVPTLSVVYTGGDAVRISRRADDAARVRFLKIAEEVGARGIIFRSGAAEFSDEKIKADMISVFAAAEKLKTAEFRAKIPSKIIGYDFSTRVALLFGAEEKETVDFSSSPYCESFAVAMAKIVCFESGNLVVEETEAFVSIDVNTGANFLYGSEEDTAFYTNMAAAEAVAKAVRLKNLAGTILVDFISMRSDVRKKELLVALQKVFSADSCKTEVTGYTKSGVYEILRERRGISVWHAVREDLC